MSPKHWYRHLYDIGRLKVVEENGELPTFWVDGVKRTVIPLIVIEKGNRYYPQVSLPKPPWHKGAGSAPAYCHQVVSVVKDGVWADDEEVHHRDRDPTNYRSSNLEQIKKVDHKALHKGPRRKRTCQFSNTSCPGPESLSETPPSSPSIPRPPSSTLMVESTT